MHSITVLVIYSTSNYGFITDSTDFSTLFSNTYSSTLVVLIAQEQQTPMQESLEVQTPFPLTLTQLALSPVAEEAPEAHV